MVVLFFLKKTWRIPIFFAMLPAVAVACSVVAVSCSKNALIEPVPVKIYNQEKLKKLLSERSLPMSDGTNVRLDGYYWKKCVARWIFHLVKNMRLSEFGEWEDPSDSLGDLLQNFDPANSLADTLSRPSEVAAQIASLLDTHIKNYFYVINNGSVFPDYMTFEYTLSEKIKNYGQKFYSLKIKASHRDPIILTKRIARFNDALTSSKSSDDLSDFVATHFGLFLKGDVVWETTEKSGGGEKTILRKFTTPLANNKIPGYETEFDYAQLLEGAEHSPDGRLTVILSWKKNAELINSAEKKYGHYYELDDVRVSTTVKLKITIKFLKQ